MTQLFRRIAALGSSTGKTRACWEAIQNLPETWRLWHPIAPGRAEAALTGISGIGPHTVVWLNDTHHYLTTPGTGLQQLPAGAREELRRRVASLDAAYSRPPAMSG
jgi:hypothetical protein